jgi:hypothetical protein
MSNETQESKELFDSTDAQAAGRSTPHIFKMKRSTFN